ncbi:hypothetical protein DYU11_16995 [Fibrisoma montanum]|uniref:Uncharacterized protein n=1 Tax=Fibrisoma montanum TaxID=2305895 RepID=A0A418M5I6_9BACT|nr:hypothetical protein [Fibrisoma montanum]RIV21124.1 hypothetical protein DYU11_16995 [Fibrisoma montanum]
MNTIQQLINLEWLKADSTVNRRFFVISLAVYALNSSIRLFILTIDDSPTTDTVLNALVESHFRNCVLLVPLWVIFNVSYEYEHRIIVRHVAEGMKPVYYFISKFFLLIFIGIFHILLSILITLLATISLKIAPPLLLPLFLVELHTFVLSVVLGVFALCISFQFKHSREAITFYLLYMVCEYSLVALYYRYSGTSFPFPLPFQSIRALTYETVGANQVSRFWQADRTFLLALSGYIVTFLLLTYRRLTQLDLLPSRHS